MPDDAVQALTPLVPAPRWPLLKPTLMVMHGESTYLLMFLRTTMRVGCLKKAERKKVKMTKGEGQSGSRVFGLRSFLRMRRVSVFVVE